MFCVRCDVALSAQLYLCGVRYYVFILECVDREMMLIIILQMNVIDVASFLQGAII